MGLRRVFLVPVLALAAATGWVSPAASAPGAAAHLSSTVSTHHLLDGLKVHREHANGYRRSEFPTWESVGDGCDVRDAVLTADATKTPTVAEPGCELVHGKWTSPYDGVHTTNPSTFDIDHLVPVAEAWQSGAFRWKRSTREAYANDLGYFAELIAVSAHSNRSKGDQEPQQWLPPRTSYDCTYMAEWVAVKWRWRLTVDHGEKQFLHASLGGCGWPRIARPTRAAIHDKAHSGSGGTPPPPAPAHHQCTTTSSGSCIKSGEFCPKDDYGHDGYDADGDRLVCTGDTSHPHWERS